ncbi:MAG: hypothetical protein JWL88_754 [Parcubacteria group bacterium]|nr:hypothetical protein [Parcubacteria group bacterium]
MNKNRIEALSDGIFAIVLTILVFDLKIPAGALVLTNADFLSQLLILWPVIVSITLSFIVICVFWINHNYLFHSFVKSVDRGLNLLNIVYMLFLVFIPFSARLVGEYPYIPAAAIVYGLDILMVSIFAKLMYRHVQKNAEMQHELSSRFLKQAHIRMTITPVSYFIGILCAPFFIPASIFFYLFPIVFNLIPGSLDFVERLFGFELA